MSDDVKRCCAFAEDTFEPGRFNEAFMRKGVLTLVLASDYDALRAERDALRQAMSESARLAERVGELEADRSDLIERIAREVYDVALCIRPDDEETILNAPNYMAAMVRAHKKRAALSPAPTETAGPARPPPHPVGPRGEGRRWVGCSRGSVRAA